MLLHVDTCTSIVIYPTAPAAEYHMCPALRKGTINFENFNNIITLVHSMLAVLYNVV